jgi:D-alanine-D-alanine ligase
MRRRRVALLTHADLVPPPSLEGLDPKQVQPVKTEFHVARALEELGHELRIVGVSDDLLPIRRLVEEWKPHVFFNLLMEFRDVGHYQAYVAGYLELLGIPYTGCDPRGILISRDKALAKKILRWHRILTPAFAVFDRGCAVASARGLRFPLIVKSLDEEASIGIAQASVVRDLDHLRERVRFVHERVGSAAIAEEFIEGRELSISVIGNRRLETFPVWEMIFRNLPEGSVPIATERAKFDLGYQERVGITTQAASDLTPGMAERIASLARRAFRALGLSGYARMDLRLAPDGQVFLIEANATPDVAADEDFALAGAAAGYAYPALVQRLVTLALGLHARPA